MKKLINKLTEVFSGRGHNTDNVYIICDNASGELGSYCKVEYRS